ncbi:MAG: 23S rRNA (uracil(1939)-C(5))-methyltransferase RlmD [Pseudomonadota bacterium]
MKTPIEVAVLDLSHDGRGVARHQGKAIFVAGALPGETVLISRNKRRSRHDEAELEAVVTASPDRVQAPCVHYDRCGGCALQHLQPEAQLRAKHGQLQRDLERIGKVQPATWLEPLQGPWLGYRRKARLGVRVLPKSGRAIVGFRERSSALLANVRECAVLAAPIGALVDTLGTLVSTLSIAGQVPQIEVAIGERVTVLVLRVMEAPTAEDVEKLVVFGRERGLSFWLQPGGAQTAAPIEPMAVPLDYTLPEFDLRFEFQPLDFVQVNAELNRQMVRHALDLLNPSPADRVLDLYCGLGNFTLPLARRAGEVVGIEGDESLVSRARRNAEINGLTNVRFTVADLFKPVAGEIWSRQKYDLILLDPPRAGSVELLPTIAAMQARRIVYVSCHPGSLARDAGLLVREHGYRLVSAGIMNMFPHTAHLESIAVFERDV